MNLRTGSDYLQFSGQLKLSFKTSLIGIINTSVKSYSFDVPNTAYNRSLLGITSYTDPEIFSSRSWILNDGFNDMVGKISVEGVDDNKITISFFSNVNDAISKLDISIRDVYTLGGTSIFEYTGSEYTGQTLFYGDGGYLAPPVNNGNNNNLIAGDFQEYGTYNNLPCFYIKTVLAELFNQTGVKLDGGILKDFIYNNLLLSNDSIDIKYDDEYISDSTVYVGNSSAQTITNGSTTKLNLVDNTGDFYDSRFFNLWDNTNHNYTAGYTRYELFEVRYTSSAANLAAGQIFCQLYKNGVAQVTAELDLPPDNITVTISKVFAIQLTAGDTVDLRCSNTHGSSINITATLKIYPFNTFQVGTGTTINLKGNTANLVPKLMLPDMSGPDFIKNTLSILNPVIQFDANKRTLKIDLFKDIKHNTEVDWSDYIKDYEFSYFENFVVDYGKKSYMKYADSDESNINEYNKKFSLMFGGGIMRVDNDFIEKSVDVFQSQFGASSHSFNDVTGSMLLDFPFYSRDIDSRSVNVTNVTIAAPGLCGTSVTFTTDINHNFKIGDWVYLFNFAAATNYNGFAKVQGVASDTTFSVVMRSPTVPSTTGKVSPVTINESSLTHKLLIGIPNITVSDYYIQGLNFRCSNETTYCYAYFINPLPNGSGNTSSLNLCFDMPNVNGLSNSLSLKDVYWREFEQVLNKPVVLIARMLIPENEMFNLDISKPIRIKTEKFNNLFMLLECSDYENNYTECEVRLLRL